jgi:hemerythrin
MAFIEWNDRFSVNVESIDDQHKQLVNLINKLYDGMKADKTKQVLGEIIDELVDYTKVHFKEEEAYFERYGYEETEEHKEEHQKFIKEIASFKKAFDSNRITVSIKVMIFLRDWLYSHILKTDKKYMQFMQMNSVI